MHFPTNLRLNTVKTGRSFVSLLRPSIGTLILNLSENFKSSSNFSPPSWNHLNICMQGFSEVRCFSPEPPRPVKSDAASRQQLLPHRSTLHQAWQTVTVSPLEVKWFLAINFTLVNDQPRLSRGLTERIKLRQPKPDKKISLILRRPEKRRRRRMAGKLTTEPLIHWQWNSTSSINPFSTFFVGSKYYSASDDDYIILSDF